MTKLLTALVIGVVALALLTTQCRSGPQDLTWDATPFPVRADLGDFAPADEQNQRLFSDVSVTLNMLDGRQYTVEARSFWVVLHLPTNSPNDPLGFFELTRPLVDLDDAAMIPELSELAAAFGYQFDEAAATEWVTTNDDGFRLHLNAATIDTDVGVDAEADDYDIVLEAEDRVGNTVKAFIYFPIEGETTTQPPSSEPPLFDLRPIDE